MYHLLLPVALSEKVLAYFSFPEIFIFLDSPSLPRLPPPSPPQSMATNRKAGDSPNSSSLPLSLGPSRVWPLGSSDSSLG